jgi:tetratricopeptide (TPR) repeat protein
LHRSVGEGIEDIYQHRIKEFYEELASHYLQGEVISKAIYYLLRTGEKAKGMYAYQKAIGYFNNALELIQKQPEKEREPSMEMALREALGEALFTIGYHHEAEIQLKQALDIASKRGDSQYLAALTYKLADAIHWQRDFDRAREMAEPALLMLDEQPNCPERLNLLELISRSYWPRWDWESSPRQAVPRLCHGSSAEEGL